MIPDLCSNFHLNQRPVQRLNIWDVNHLLDATTDIRAVKYSDLQIHEANFQAFIFGGQDFLLHFSSAHSHTCLHNLETKD